MKRQWSRHRTGLASWLCLFALALCARLSLAGTLQRAEVRIDAGLAREMSLVAANPRPLYWEGDFQLQLSSSNLSVGSHWVEVRLQDGNGVWCAWQGQRIRVTGPVHLAAAEWFVDTDPGPGQGTAIPAPKDGVWDGAEENILVSGNPSSRLSVGRHTLYLRTKDSQGDWGLPNRTVFYVAEPLRLVKAEWTTDPKARPGTGFPLGAADGALDGAEEDLSTDATTDQVGPLCSVHSLYVRVQDNLGRWSSRQGLVWTPSASEPGGAWGLDLASAWSNAAVEGLTVVPGIPAAPAPAHDSTWLDHQKTNVVLKWSACVGADGYDVLFWRQGRAQTRYSTDGMTNTTLTVSIPEIRLDGWPGSPYYWQVSAKALAGCASAGPVWYFRVPGIGDADGDGMPDEWERTHFGSPASSNPLTDHDNDGILDWQEYVAGTNPNDKGDFFLIHHSRLSQDSLVISWAAIPDRVYTVYGTTDLALEWDKLMPTTNGPLNALPSLSYTNATYVENPFFLRVAVELTK